MQIADELELLVEEKQKRNFSKCSTKELCLFASSLNRLLEGGVPLLKSLQVIQRESPRPTFKEVLTRLEEEIRQGKSVSQALGDQKLFPSYFIQMVQAGELSGNLDKVLGLLAEYLEKEEERKRKIKEALAYPCLILGLGFATFFVLLKWVVPKLASVYSDFGAELPLVTRIVLALSDFFIPFVILFLIALGAFAFFLRKKKEKLLPFFRKSFLSRFASLLSIELQSGIPILQALDSFGDLGRARELLSEGRGFADSLKGYGWVSEKDLALISSGEESGKLPEALAQVARESQRDMESQANLMIKLLEPALILGVGLAVGFIVVSTILPILEINELVR